MKKIAIIFTAVLVSFTGYMVLGSKARADEAPDTCAVYKNCLVYTDITTDIDIDGFQNQVYLVKATCLLIECTKQPNPDTSQYSYYSGDDEGGSVIALDKSYVDGNGGLDALFNHVSVVDLANKSEAFEYPKNDAEFKKHEHPLYVYAELAGLDYMSSPDSMTLGNKGKQGDILPFNPYGSIESNDTDGTQGYQIVGSGLNEVVVIYKPLGFLCDTDPCKLVLYAAEQDGDTLVPSTFNPPTISGLVATLYPTSTPVVTITGASGGVQQNQASQPAQRSFWSTIGGFFTSLWRAFKGSLKY